MVWCQSGRRWVWIPDAEAVWKVAPVTSESADGSSYTVVAANGRGEIEVGLLKRSTRMLCIPLLSSIALPTLHDVFFYVLQ